MLVLFLRELIAMPVQDATPTASEIGMWVGGAFMMGVLHVRIRWSQKQS